MNRATKYIDRRFKTILGATQNVRPGSDVIRELVELSQAVEDEPLRSDVVARLTTIRADHSRTIVEVHSNATYSSFYHFYAQQGTKRSTKRSIRTASRSDGPSLEMIARKLAVYQSQSNPIVQIKLRIIRKRVYRRLISARPDQLGLTHCAPVSIYRPVPAGRS